MARDMSHSIRRGLMNASAEEAVPWLAVLKAWLSIPDGLNGGRAEEIFGDGKVDYGGKVKKVVTDCLRALVTDWTAH